MARQETVTFTDDIDGDTAHETVAFGLDGVNYEIDLHNSNAAALRKTLAELVAAARQVNPDNLSRRPTDRRAPSRRTTRPAGKPPPPQIRHWAAAAGPTGSDRGRIPAALLDQYLTARATAEAPS